MTTRDEVIEVLKTVNDPEINVDIWSLGLIYEIAVSGETVEILMTFTSPVCPLGPIIIEDVKQKVGAIRGVKDVKVEITFEPLWTADWMSEDIRAVLGF